MEREEAINKVRQMSLPKETMEILQALAPELAESDDERARKELVEYHKQQFEKNRDQEIGLFHKDAIAWLEKQKDASKAIEAVDRIIRDAIRRCDKMSVSWTNGEMTGHLDSVDHDFIVDVSNAFARLCDRREQTRNTPRGRESSKIYATSSAYDVTGTKPENPQGRGNTPIR